MKIKINDDLIFDLVSSVKHKIPGYVKEKLEQEIKKGEIKERKKKKRYLLWYPASAFALALIITLSVLFPFRKQNVEISPITEIRTELELKDQNIKILWFQKKDFKLNRRKKL